MIVERKRATLRDVSSEAGVSVFTASRALTGHAGVAEQTQQLVRDAARRLGYVANQHARNLKGSRSTVIGVIAASKANQYYATLVGGLEEAVEAQGYSCFVADAVLNGIYLPAREDRIVRSFIEQRVAAVVAAYSLENANLALLHDWGIPVLFVDCLPPEGWAYPSVSTDNYAASLAMGQHLAALGYRRWCFVGHASNWNTREPRQRGFEAAASACGATVEILEGGNESEVARRVLTSMLARTSAEERAAAVFASNTVLLRGVMLGLDDCGLRVPDDMAVVAFDDFDWAALLASPVTVVDQHIALVGRTAGNTVLAALDEGRPSGDAPRRVTVASTLRVRESCGCKLDPARRPGTRGGEVIGGRMRGT